MEEIYAFPARVAQRWGNGQVQIVPENPVQYMQYRTRANLRGNVAWHEQGLFVTVSDRALVAQSQGADMVTYSVQARGQGPNRRMYGVDLHPL